MCYLINLIKGICMVAVNCFVLISGYFLVDSKFNWMKVFKFESQILFYSISIFAILLILGKVDFNFKNVIYSLFPVCTNMDGFSTEYIMMYILSPYLNIFINNMNAKQHKTLLIILVILFVIIPDLFCFMGTTYDFGGAYGVVWFILLYFTGAYIKKYVRIDEIKKQKYLITYVTLALLVPLSSICSMILYKITGIVKFFEFKQLFYSYNSILVYPASISLFVLFLSIDIKNSRLNKMILSLSSTTFGIYLIHDNRFIREILWKEIINPCKYANDANVFVALILSVLLIYLICSIIEKVRAYLFNVYKI